MARMISVDHYTVTPSSCFDVAELRTEKVIDSAFNHGAPGPLHYTLLARWFPGAHPWCDEFPVK